MVKKICMIVILLGGLLMAGFGTSIILNNDASSYMENKTSKLQKDMGIDVDWQDNKTVGIILLVGGVIGFFSAFFLSKMLFAVAAVLILAGAAPLLEDPQVITVTFPIILAGVALIVLKNKIL